MLHIHETPPVADVVAQHDEIGGEQCIVRLRGCGVVEREAVEAVVQAYVPDEGLVEIAQQRGGGIRLLPGGVGAMA